jgi:Spy/CpxP family protein refolding chaperone
VRRWGLALALLLSLGVNLGILATLAIRRAGPPDRPPRPEERPLPPGPGGEETPLRVIRLADRLGLEGAQRRRFVQMQGRFFLETLRLRTEQAEIFRELRRELTAPEPDSRRIEELTRSSAQTHLALQQAMARNVAATRELLDPEQERLYLDIISRLRPPGLAGEPQRPRRPPPWQQRRPRWQE